MTLTLLVLVVAAGALLFQAARLRRRWSQGSAAQVDIVGGIRRLPRAYLHTVHDVMSRERRVAWMHALVAGGTVAAILSVALQVLTGSSALTVLVVLASGLALIGAAIAAHRRRAACPDWLSGEEFDRLPYALMTLHTGFFLSAFGQWWGSKFQIPGIVLCATGAIWLVLKAVRGPMRHAVAGVVHLIAHPRPERFEPDRPATALLPPVSETPHHGIGQVQDFAWNRLVMFDACVQCGKCEAACPAYAAGQPLNPKN